MTEKRENEKETHTYIRKASKKKKTADGAPSY